MNSVFIGKIVNTHGIKGEIRIKSDFEFKNRVFVVGHFLIIRGCKYKILSYRVHKEWDMVTLEGTNDINEAIPFKGSNVYFDRDDLKLDDGEYILSDLIGMRTFINGVEMGIVNDYNNGVNSLIEIKYNNIVYYVPVKGNFIDRIDFNEGIIYLKDEAKELILWE